MGPSFISTRRARDSSTPGPPRRAATIDRLVGRQDVGALRLIGPAALELAETRTRGSGRAGSTPVRETLFRSDLSSTQETLLR
jgi:hypothetical protein